MTSPRTSRSLSTARSAFYLRNYLTGRTVRLTGTQEAYTSELFEASNPLPR